MKIKKIIKLIVAIGITQLAGYVGSIFTAPAISTWYATLKKPYFMPPNWVFAPVWTLLFIMMGIAAYLVLEKGWSNKKVKIALVIFLLQLVLNVFWSVLFFGLQSPFLALIEIVFLLVAIFITFTHFCELDNWAGYLMLPYLGWVSFALLLNLFILILN